MERIHDNIYEVTNYFTHMLNYSLAIILVFQNGMIDSDKYTLYITY